MGVTLAYTVKGQGRPLILLHGNGEDHTIFKEAADVLSESFTCYCVDSRGHGQSTPCGELHYRDMAADMAAFMDALDLKDAVFCGFSDGGIIGIMTAALTDRISVLIPCGANVSPDGVKPWLKKVFEWLYKLTKDPKIEMMLTEPDITDEELQSITAKTFVVAGSKDLVVESETRHIAEMIPDAQLCILEGETHTSYTVHTVKLADLILGFVSE